MNAAVRTSTSAVEEAALVEWRRKATGIVLRVVAALHLPGILGMLFGYGPAMAPLMKAIAMTCYLVIALAALLTRIEYRTRVWAFYIAGCIVIAVLNIALPDGPYAQIGLATLPVPGLVLLGPAAARMAAVAGLAVLLSAPWMRTLPSITNALGITPEPLHQIVWMHAAATAAFLVSLLILLERFHAFLIESLAAQCLATAGLERESAERLAAQREVANVSDGERRRLGHELHDGVCQQVAAAALHCKALARRVERGAAIGSIDFDAISNLLGETLDETRNVALGLCPLDPDPDALAAAVQALTRRVQQTADLRCEFISSGDVRVHDLGVAQHLYRVAQEALSNAVRHAHATRITITLSESNGALLLQIEDNGVGLPLDPPRGGMGLRTMLYRARILDGEFTTAVAPGGGTRITCRVPLREAS